jgi:hypothetical protein
MTTAVRTSNLTSVTWPECWSVHQHQFSGSALEVEESTAVWMWRRTEHILQSLTCKRKRWKRMYSADKFLCVPLYSRCRSARNFVRLGTLLQISFDCFLFLYSLTYMQHDYYQRTSVCDVIRCQLAYSIASPTKERNWISRTCYQQMVITP